MPRVCCHRAMSKRIRKPAKKATKRKVSQAAKKIGEAVVEIAKDPDVQKVVVEGGKTLVIEGVKTLIRGG